MVFRSPTQGLGANCLHNLVPMVYFSDDLKSDEVFVRADTQSIVGTDHIAVYESIQRANGETSNYVKTW